MSRLARALRRFRLWKNPLHELKSWKHEPLPLRVQELEDRITPAFNLFIDFHLTVGNTTSNVTVTDNGVTRTFTASGGGATLDMDDITNAIAVDNRNVVVDSGSAGGQAGNITSDDVAVGFGS